MQRILAPRSPEKPPPRSLPLAFSSEQTIQPYSQNLLAHAQALFDFADSHRGSYIDVIPSGRDYYNSSGYHDELIWSALWLSIVACWAFN